MIEKANHENQVISERRIYSSYCIVFCGYSISYKYKYTQICLSTQSTVLKILGIKKLRYFQIGRKRLCYFIKSSVHFLPLHQASTASTIFFFVCCFFIKHSGI